MKKCLITGISGQDGSFLAEYLLEKGYQVFGTVKSEMSEAGKQRLNNIIDKIQLITTPLLELKETIDIIEEIMPDECYHLAAKSFVSYDFEEEMSTMNTNTSGTHVLLSSLKLVAPHCKFYFAGSSEMFGLAQVMPQNEQTAFNPRSIYGISKLVGHHLTTNYRNAKNMFACTGILFNHESPRRGTEFVTRKITMTAAKIKLGLEEEIRLGNIKAKRDWGYAGDYVKIMHKMLCNETAQDYVIGTGQLHTVENFLEKAFSRLDLDYKKYLVIDQKYYRPSEKNDLVADNTKAKNELQFEPTKTFDQIVSMMVDNDYQLLKNNLKG